MSEDSKSKILTRLGAFDRNRTTFGFRKIGLSIEFSIRPSKSPDRWSKEASKSFSLNAIGSMTCDRTISSMVFCA